MLDVEKKTRGKTCTEKIHTSSNNYDPATKFAWGLPKIMPVVASFSS